MALFGRPFSASARWNPWARASTAMNTVTTSAIPTTVTIVEVFRTNRLRTL